MIEHAVRSKLVATAALTALVGTRIYQLVVPQGATVNGPAIRLQVVSEPKNYHLRGEDGATRTRLQIDIYKSVKVSESGDPYSDVMAIADAVDDVLSGKVFESEGLRITGAFRNERRVGYEAPELGLLRCALEYTVWFKEI